MYVFLSLCFSFATDEQGPTLLYATNRFVQHTANLTLCKAKMAFHLPYTHPLTSRRTA